jgi:hypothetical protein
LDVIYLFDETRTREEIHRNRSRYPRLEKALEWLITRKAILAPIPNLTLRGVGGPLTASVVHDASLEISTVLHKVRYCLWLEEVGGAANDLWNVLEDMSQHGTDLFDFVDGLSK